MSYSNSVKVQYYGIGLATGVLIACLVAGLLIAHTSGKTCAGQLIRQSEGLYCFSNLGQIQEDDVR
jgi:prolipoprotein diacylglyceryltransferase